MSRFPVSFSLFSSIAAPAVAGQIMHFAIFRFERKPIV
jgi:hypothetical protein